MRAGPSLDNLDRCAARLADKDDANEFITAYREVFVFKRVPTFAFSADAEVRGGVRVRRECVARSAELAAP